MGITNYDIIDVDSVVTDTLANSGNLSNVGTFTSTGRIVWGTETIIAAGALGLLSGISQINSVGAIALTLADGANGQMKFVVMGVDGGDAVLTPATKTGFSTITFNDIGDGVTLVFLTTRGWIITGNNGATVA